MRKLKKVFAVFMAIAFIFGTTPVYALSNTGIMAKTEYLQTEKAAYNKLMKSINASEYGKLLKFTESISGNYSSEIDLEIEIPEVKTRKYVVKENGTYTDRYEDGVIEAYVENEKVASLDIVANDNLVSIRVPELYEKYLTVDMNDLAGLVNKFVEDKEEAQSIIETLPKGMVYACDLMEYLKFTEEEERILNTAGKKYIKLLDEEFLKPTYFIKGDNETLSINNKAYNCDVVSYEISLRQLVEGFEKVWKEFKNDTELVNLIWGKTEGLYNKMKEVNVVTEELPTKEQVLAVVDYLLAELKVEDSVDVFLKSTLYHQDDKLLRRDISVEYQPLNENTYSLSEEDALLCSIYTVSGEYYALCMEDFKLEDFVTANLNETVNNIVVTSKSIDYEMVEKEIEVPVSYYDLEAQETRIEYEIDYDYDWVEREIEEVNKATVKVIKVNDNQCNFEISVEDSDDKVVLECIKNKETSKEYDASINVDITSEGQTFGINTRMIYKKDVALNKIDTKGNEINLNKKSKEELMKLFEENKDKIIEKAQGKFLSAFYYEEIMEATQKTMDRMNSRMENSTGAMIGKATRVWLTDYTTDYDLRVKLNESNVISSTRWIKVQDLCGIDEYAYVEATAEGYDYYVAITNEELDGKIIVALSKTGLDLPYPTTVTDISEETNGARVIYIEP